MGNNQTAKSNFSTHLAQQYDLQREAIDPRFGDIQVWKNKT